MPYRLPKLPYAPQAFGEFLSRESFAYHYDKHHQAYLDQVNKLVAGTDRAALPLEDVVRLSSRTDPRLFNQAAQAWNHAFFWFSMTPESVAPTGPLEAAIDRAFGSRAEFSRAWVEKGAAQFGSGWVWLVREEGGQLAILTTPNAETPLTLPCRPLICADVWEHAYYIDHRNDRKKFLTQWTHHIDWRFAAANLARTDAPPMGETMRA